MSVSIKRFYWLDIMRGIAALSVVLWHWQHFFLHDSPEESVNQLVIRNSYPLYKIFRPFYEQGWRAVELFFTLSGFIFFWLYSERIANNKVSFKKYLTLRISRLYPLHILTLVVVIFGQLWYYAINHSHFVYNNYSITSFFTNLTLTSSWISSEFSFNGPSWSVSVEMLLYLVFFTACRFQIYKWWSALIFIGVGWLLKDTFLFSMGTGIVSFFAGGIAYYFYNYAKDKLSFQLKIAFFLLIPMTILTAFTYRYILKHELPIYFYELILFPLIISSVALAESIFGSSFGKRIAVIGDISYSSYLWHFPLQLFFVIATSLLGWNRSIFYSPWMLLSFYVLLIPISLLSYHNFEIPLQTFLRKKLLREGNLNKHQVHS